MATACVPNLVWQPGAQSLGNGSSIPLVEEDASRDTRDGILQVGRHVRALPPEEPQAREVQHVGAAELPLVAAR
jgi:hypothetical protein